MGKYKGFAGAGMNQKQNMNSVIKQAQKMQEEMERVQQETEEEELEATSGGGAVKDVYILALDINVREEVVPHK